MFNSRKKAKIRSGFWTHLRMKHVFNNCLYSYRFKIFLFLWIAVSPVGERSSTKMLLETYIENEKALKKANSFKIKLPDKSCKKKKALTVPDNTNKDKMLLNVLNRFIFYTFLIYIISLNIICLYFLPYHVRKDLTINDPAF